MSELDTLLESVFQEAANRETFARQIEAKIKDIEGAEETIYVITYPRMDKKLQIKPDYCNTTVMYASDY